MRFQLLARGNHEKADRITSGEEDRGRKRTGLDIRRVRKAEVVPNNAQYAFPILLTIRGEGDLHSWDTVHDRQARNSGRIRTMPCQSVHKLSHDVMLVKRSSFESFHSKPLASLLMVWIGVYVRGSHLPFKSPAWSFGCFFSPLYPVRNQSSSPQTTHLNHQFLPQTANLTHQLLPSKTDFRLSLSEAKLRTLMTLKSSTRGIEITGAFTAKRNRESMM